MLEDKNKIAKAKKIVKNILDNLNTRSGFDFDDIDSVVKKEIEQDLVSIVLKEIK